MKELNLCLANLVDNFVDLINFRCKIHKCENIDRKVNSEKGLTGDSHCGAIDCKFEELRKILFKENVVQETKLLPGSLSTPLLGELTAVACCFRTSLIKMSWLEHKNTAANAYSSQMIFCFASIIKIICCSLILLH